MPRRIGGTLPKTITIPDLHSDHFWAAVRNFRTLCSQNRLIGSFWDTDGHVEFRKPGQPYYRTGHFRVARTMRTR